MNVDTSFWYNEVCIHIALPVRMTYHNYRLAVN